MKNKIIIIVITVIITTALFILTSTAEVSYTNELRINNTVNGVEETRFYNITPYSQVGGVIRFNIASDEYRSLTSVTSNKNGETYNMDFYAAGEFIVIGTQTYSKEWQINTEHSSSAIITTLQGGQIIVDCVTADTLQNNAKIQVQTQVMEKPELSYKLTVDYIKNIYTELNDKYYSYDENDIGKVVIMTLKYPTPHDERHQYILSLDNISVPNGIQITTENISVSGKASDMMVRITLENVDETLLHQSILNQDSKIILQYKIVKTALYQVPIDNDDEIEEINETIKAGLMFNNIISIAFIPGQVIHQVLDIDVLGVNVYDTLIIIITAILIIAVIIFIIKKV